MRALGQPTRGTTAAQRLRRVDRWLTGVQAARLRAAPPRPVVVDLGFGAAPTTTLELAARVRAVRPDAEVVGVEIDRGRVAAAAPHAAEGVRFVAGGFELAGLAPFAVRAMNVLRQYDEAQVAPAWAEMTARLAPGGLLVEGTCDELGRLGSWVALEAGASEPHVLVLAARLGSMTAPSVLAERLPKALIHRNVQGEPIHALLRDADRAWAATARLIPYGPRQRWRAMAEALRADWPVLDGPTRWRLGELSVPWSAIAPRS
ncbi:MAG TPA: class I SAM-dependent methyltransferase [Mycobacteriales bacterium]|nr:class I SAM-dependent methyltransferase [Mycobacteriales bacterium]